MGYECHCNLFYGIHVTSDAALRFFARQNGDASGDSEDEGDRCSNGEVVEYLQKWTKENKLPCYVDTNDSDDWSERGCLPDEWHDWITFTPSSSDHHYSVCNQMVAVSPQE